MAAARRGSARRGTHIQVPPVLPQHARRVLRVLLTRRIAVCLHHLELLVAQSLQRGHGGHRGRNKWGRGSTPTATFTAAWRSQ